METTAKSQETTGLLQKAFNNVEEKTPSIFNRDGHKTRQIILGNPPAKSNCYRIIILKNKDKTKQHASLAKSEELKKYEADFALQCSLYRRAHINVPFEIKIDCHFRSKQSDLDNALKVILDCLQAAEAISNDNLCEHIDIGKFVDPVNPRIEFTLRAKEPLKEWVPKKKKVKKVTASRKSASPVKHIETVTPPLF